MYQCLVYIPTSGQIKEIGHYDYPKLSNLSLFETGTSLTVRAYVEVKESGNIEMAAAIGIVILMIVFTLNLISRLISKKFSKANY